jgi:enterochelin esterase-like enzyme
MRLLFALLALVLWLPASAGVVVTREFDSPALQRKWSYAVYLPDGYDTSTLRYPVLYLLHGHGQDLYDWANSGHIQQTADALIAHGDMPPAIIVMPDAGTSWYVDRKEKMETAVIQDLVGDAEHTFRAIRARDGRLVAGLSMGGYGALRFVLKYPEMFAAAALLSPAIYDPEPPQGSGARKAGVFGTPEFDPQVWKELNYPALWDAFLAKKIAVPIYIDSGDDDTFFIEAEATRLYSLLRKNGQPAELRIVDGGHDWQVWESTIGDALRYVFRFAARPALTPKDAQNDAKGRKSR